MKLVREGQTGEQPPNYVSSVQKDCIIIPNPLNNLTEDLAHLGGHFEEDSWIIRARDNVELAVSFTALRDYGVLFMGEGHGWSPSAIFEHLREAGLLSGNFYELTFRGPGRWAIYER